MPVGLLRLSSVWNLRLQAKVLFYQANVKTSREKKRKKKRNKRKKVKKWSETLVSCSIPPFLQSTDEDIHDNKCICFFCYESLYYLNEKSICAENEVFH